VECVEISFALRRRLGPVLLCLDKLVGIVWVLDMEYGIWLVLDMEYGIWNMVGLGYGIWNMVGRFIVHRSDFRGGQC
jgi:hypothetical protein